MNLVTHQTGPQGQTVRKVYVEAGCDIAKESIPRDAPGPSRAQGRTRIVTMASAEGGVEIEEVAAKTPEKILKVWADPAGRVAAATRRGSWPSSLGLDRDVAAKLAQFASALSKAYMDTDASLAEINPLVVTEEGELLALDAKFNFDDNALFRHPDIGALARRRQEDAGGASTRTKCGLNYIALDGNIGCLVNGAGLAMATMDIIKLHGGEPANFLDVGGGATEEQVTEAFRIILSDPKVKGDPGQHLRRHHQVRRHRRRHRRGGRRSGRSRAAGRAARGDER